MAATASTVSCARRRASRAEASEAGSPTQTVTEIRHRHWGPRYRATTKRHLATPGPRRSRGATWQVPNAARWALRHGVDHRWTLALIITTVSLGCPHIGMTAR